MNSDNLAKVENTDNGVVYLVLDESSENIQSANITLTFEIIAAGDPDLTLEISDMYAADESDIPAPTNQANGKITGIEKETEPVETTPRIESTDPETTTTSSTSDDTSNTTTGPSTQKPTSSHSCSLQFI